MSLSPTAQFLLDIDAVHVNIDKPFTLTSGRLSPVYIDCRKLISFLPERRRIMQDAADLLTKECDMTRIDYIAGGETAGIPYAAFLSELLDKPMLYVRKNPKGFGRGAQIEGDMPEGAQVLFVEDLTTDGGSKIKFVDVLRDDGARVTDIFSLFFYDIYPESLTKLADAGLHLHYLATWKDILTTARETGHFCEKDIINVETYLADPMAWSAAQQAKTG